AYKAMWTDHEEVASVLANLVTADELQARGVRVKPSYTERVNYIPAEYAGGLREKVFDRAGPKAWADYQNVFAGRPNESDSISSWMVARQFIWLQIQKYRIELDSPPLSLVGSTNRKMMLTIFSNKLDFHGPFKVTIPRRFVRRIHAGKLREKSAMFPVV